MSTARRVGLFGGSFDPPHLAHLALARAAVPALALDELRWIPAAQPWQKTRALSTAAHREAMVRLTIADEPAMRLDRIEIERGGASRSLDTVQALCAREPATRWVLLIGGDQYARLHSWHGWQQLLALVELAVARRPGAETAPDAVPGAASDGEPAAARQQHPHTVLPLPMMDISATDIRARVARGDRVDDLVTPAVARYIEQHRLYKN